MKKNYFKEVVEKQCELKNKQKSFREIKYKPKFEIQKVAKALGVHFMTAYAWYSNDSNPRGANYRNLPEYYGLDWQDFYYFDENRLAK